MSEIIEKEYKTFEQNLDDISECKNKFAKLVGELDALLKTVIKQHEEVLNENMEYDKFLKDLAKKTLEDNI